MKRFLLPASFLLLTTVAHSAAAQQPSNRTVGTQEPAVPPEMWYYQQQLERFDDPKTAVRRNAEFQAQQRMARLETMRWYGYSPARPTVSPAPFASAYRVAWQSSFYGPYSWYAPARPAIVRGHGSGE